LLFLQDGFYGSFQDRISAAEIILNVDIDLDVRCVSIHLDGPVVAVGDVAVRNPHDQSAWKHGIYGNAG